MHMFGFDRHTGKPISGVAHLRQSIEHILTTRIGTRVMLRDYASGLQELVDDPINGALKVEAFARPGRKPGIDGRACAIRSALEPAGSVAGRHRQRRAQGHQVDVVFAQ
jgi:hypothetical protein